MRNAAGPHKNDPGRSRAVYAPIADLFSTGGVSGVAAPSTSDADVITWDLEETAAGLRACMRSEVGARYLVLVWQEHWTANPFARSKFIRGKLLYQKVRAPPFHCLPNVDPDE